MDKINNKKPYKTIVTILLISIGICLSGNTLAANASTAQLAAEMAARRAADTTEKNARIAADTVEKTARTAADNRLNTGLTTEQNARIAADAAESAARSVADTAEVTARQQAIQSAINALQAQLNAIALPPPPVSGTRPKAGLSLKLCPNNDTPQWDHCPLAIGDTGPAGGIVFYVTDGGMQGLEAAPVDQEFAPWGCVGTPITGADSHTVGSGAQNTLAILAGCNEAGIAAKVAADYTLNGYSDWFLPSIDELNLMYLNIGQGATFHSGNYWSSSENGAIGAWNQPFYDITSNLIAKVTLTNVRAVRSF